MPPPRKLILQKVEDAVRAPEVLDDTVLDAETDNAARQVIAETNPRVLSDTLFVIVSQLRQVLYGSAPGHWSDLPLISLKEVFDLYIGKLVMSCLPSVAVGDLVFQSTVADNTAVTCTNNTDVEPAFGIVTAKRSTVAAEVLYQGMIASSLTRGKVFLGIDGRLTKTLPAAGYIQHLGISFGNGMMLFNPTLARTKRST
jgi:hypothetical protein